MEVKNWGFCDLSINRCFDLKELSNLAKFGYQTVAINTVVEVSNDEPKRKKKKENRRSETTDFIPAPLEIPQDIKDTCKLNILQRITLEYSDVNISHKIITSDNVKKYDILAVLPKSLQAFQYACTVLDTDVITFTPEIKLPYRINRKLYRKASDRGIYFELMYSPAISDSTSRKNIISTAHTYHVVGKSKNIILTSGASNLTQVRGTHDAVSLGFILGLNTNQSLEVIRDNARKLILRAQSRRCGKHFMIITPIDSDNKTVEQ